MTCSGCLFMPPFHLFPGAAYTPRVIFALTKLSFQVKYYHKIGKNCGFQRVFACVKLF